MRFEIPKMMNPDNLYYVDLPDQLKADQPVLNDPLTANEIRDNIAKVVFAQNCYTMSMTRETSHTRRAALFGLFSGNSGVTLNLALQWLKLRERQPLSWPNISRMRLEIAKIQQIRQSNPWYPFDEYFKMGQDDLPDSFVEEFIRITGVEIGKS